MPERFPRRRPQLPPRQQAARGAARKAAETHRLARRALALEAKILTDIQNDINLDFNRFGENYLSASMPMRDLVGYNESLGHWPAAFRRGRIVFGHLCKYPRPAGVPGGWRVTAGVPSVQQDSEAVPAHERAAIKRLLEMIVWTRVPEQVTPQHRMPVAVREDIVSEFLILGTELQDNMAAAALQADARDFLRLPKELTYNAIVHKMIGGEVRLGAQ